MTGNRITVTCLKSELVWILALLLCKHHNIASLKMFCNFNFYFASILGPYNWSCLCDNRAGNKKAATEKEDAEASTSTAAASTPTSSGASLNKDQASGAKNDSKKVKLCYYKSRTHKVSFGNWGLWIESPTIRIPSSPDSIVDPNPDPKTTIESTIAISIYFRLKSDPFRSFD